MYKYWTRKLNIPGWKSRVIIWDKSAMDKTQIFIQCGTGVATLLKMFLPQLLLIYKHAKLANREKNYSMWPGLSMHLICFDQISYIRFRLVSNESQINTTLPSLFKIWFIKCQETLFQCLFEPYLCGKATVSKHILILFHDHVVSTKQRWFYKAHTSLHEKFENLYLPAIVCWQYTSFW